MDMFEGVGRRQDECTGQLVDIGAKSLNGRERKLLFRNNGDGTFTGTAFANGADREEGGRAVAVFDYDGDGGLDLLLRNCRQPTQLLWTVGPRGRWIALKLTGTRSNRDAVGSRVRVRTADGGWQTRIVTDGSGYLSNPSVVQHFALASDAEVIFRKIVDERLWRQLPGVLTHVFLLEPLRIPRPERIENRLRDRKLML